MSYLDRDPFGIYRDNDSAGPGPRLMGADTLMGEDVYNRQEEDLGDIKEIMLDMQSGQISYAVLSFGGILGMGNKLFAVPWQSLQLDTVNKRFILDVPKEKLENAPGFDKDNWPDMASAEFGSQMSGFWGTQQALPGQRTSSGSVMGSGTSTMQSESSFGQSSMGDRSAGMSNSSMSGTQGASLTSGTGLSGSSAGNLGSAGTTGSSSGLGSSAGNLGTGSGLSSQSDTLGNSSGLGSTTLDLTRGDDLTDKNVNQVGGLSNQNTSIDPNKKF
ncbi:sporulation protein YlmC with PRC-barrel domain [Pseudoduganella lurida]|uniref:Sporulation protein YlmC with PRC-barrel domain n=1 Tax=Pseudoduganella lurida TaxID=1036180 RepID=A0A562QZ90_9BURK|nr:PRC-barrel domain-containing protein [Pseudoduganella lurida]TWI62122.1 sporulation protein YlmC with PRC-barrel domain [Pseudoduganella lurida]